MKHISLWEVKYSEFKDYINTLYGEEIKNILIQDNTMAKIYLNDNRVITVFSWDFDYLNVPRMSTAWACYGVSRS
jgi:hypothetical protein